ncbi:MAG: hypothetical protein OXE77_05590 [Flavobacteriaceae bacterium]|nr:hypothetical protein [Flavobacteriaceae bacterium]
MGSVYESLLAYRGFYAEEDYIEVHEKNNSKKGTFLVVRRRLDDFHHDEVLKDAEGNPRFLEKGDFVYRLSGRDRTKSASYYTPEILTKSTVRYTLKPILEKIENGDIGANDILNLKILEPAMGAAAFLNEVVNQLAEVYLHTRKKETNKEISPKDYQKELHIVKAYIATNNSYGVDINPTAIELGKLSIWLNILHKGMQSPFFGSRLGVGNAVIGAWFKTFSVSQLKKEKWWTCEPQIVEFKDGEIIREQNHIYHFLLPDYHMVPSAKNIKLLKQEFPSEGKYIAQYKKENCKPINNEELDQLRVICNKIDVLLAEHYSYQMESGFQTQISLSVWEMEKVHSKKKQLEINFNEKDSINQNRNKKSSPYYKIKFIMDYWCSLWFWDIRDAYDLPNRNQWISDIQILLGLKNRNSKESYDLESTTLEKLKIESHKSHLFDKKNRLDLVEKIAINQKFFHFQLEFVEVFMERGGFDLIVGNPPWVRSQFEEKEVMSELYPELIIRKISAPNTRKRREEYLQIENQRESYYRQYIETDSTANFLGGYQNYPLLKGHRSNLYKNVLANCLQLVSKKGIAGLLHPESIYDFPKGQDLRREMYSRLVYHFQFQNKLKLFLEVDSHTIFGINVYRGENKKPNFLSMNNILHPSTIDGSIAHQGMGECHGEKILNHLSKKFELNTKPHKSRVINITSNELKIISKTFEKSKEWESTRLVRFHSRELLKVIEKIGDFETILKMHENKIDTCWNETLGVKEGYIKRQTQYPSYKDFEFILSGPHVGVSNPLYKNPRIGCKSNGDYDSIDLTKIDNSFFARTNYIPNVSVDEFLYQSIGFRSNDSWFDHYKIAFRKMLNLKGERSLIGAIYPPKSAHLHALISVVFFENSHLVEFSGLSTSIIVDYYLRVMGAENITPNRLSFFPLGVNAKYRTELDKRTLLLNCLNIHYMDLWESSYKSDFIKSTWSKNDKRLKPFESLSEQWEWKTPLRNQYERRQALVEIDVIVAMAFGLTLEELIQIYLIEFSILQQNEYNTYYDTTGNIVFTTSMSLKGVGVDKSDWGKIKNYRGGERHKHTITKSEMYHGKEITYYAPFDKCDRVADYTIAWKHFEKLFSI